MLALVDALGNLIGFRLLPGQRHDSQGVADLIKDQRFGSFLGDNAFDNDTLRADLHDRGAKAVIPPPFRKRPVLDVWRCCH